MSNFWTIIGKFPKIGVISPLVTSLQNALQKNLSPENSGKLCEKMRKNAKKCEKMRKNAIMRKNAKKCEKMRMAFPPPCIKASESW